jgi:hypothetical protein
MIPKRSGTSADCKPLNGSRLTPASNTALSPSAASTSAPCLLSSNAIARIVHDHVVNACRTWSTALKVTSLAGIQRAPGHRACGHVTIPKSRTGSTTFAPRTAPESIVLHGKGVDHTERDEVLAVILKRQHAHHIQQYECLGRTSEFLSRMRTYKIASFSTALSRTRKGRMSALRVASRLAGGPSMASSVGCASSTRLPSLTGNSAVAGP